MDTHDQSAKNDANQPTPEEWVANGEVGFNSFASMQHALNQPNRATLTPDTILQLQSTIGNQAVQRLIHQHTNQKDLNTIERQTTATSRPTSTRMLSFITIKLKGRGIEHWWIEIDGLESYGWWPVRQPTSTGDAAWNHGVVGVPGELNAVSQPALGGTPITDPHHGHSARRKHLTLIPLEPPSAALMRKSNNVFVGLLVALVAITALSRDQTVIPLFKI